MIVYVKIDDPADLERRRLKAEADAAGRIAMYRLLVAQRDYCRLDPAEARAELSAAEADLAAHRVAPASCVLQSRMPGREATIWVVDARGGDLYLGPAGGYPPAGGDPPAGADPRQG